MDNYLLVNANILTFGKKLLNIKNGAVYVGRGTILDFGDEKTIREKYHNVTDVIDLKGKLLMPGYVDMRGHLYSGFFQNVPLNTSHIANYRDFMNKFWWKYTEKLSSDGVYYATVKGIINAIKSGVTTIFNLHSSPNCIEDSLNDVAEAFEEISMRGVISYEISNRKSDDEAEKMFDITQQFISDYSNNPLVSGIIGIYNPNEISDELLKQIARYNKKTGAGLMIQLLESEFDDEISIRKYKKYCIDRLNDLDLLNSKTILVSPNYIDDCEIDIIASTNANVVLTPGASFYKGFEFSPIDQLVARKIKMGLGSDGIYSSIASEAQFLHKLMRQKFKTFNGGNKEITEILTSSTYEIANKFVSKSIGEIKLGAGADMIVLDYIPEYEITAENLHTHLIFGILPARTVSSIINGNFVLKDYELVGLDEEEINKKYVEFAKELAKI